ncbi:inactive peptidyl-prolyl cis-trans isomerase FKBP6 [Schistocerca americana]|uniref:inactive peptidyl-prolyl cis-trans isomerase FKBP6 n=1 Tax=Schistocerca americana TaxID=7009 RepID=UPI001F5027A8|nr:inactive peptidyl-prolyl cis-trans isomerase FKBP6 [Schistocerca americana]
MDPDQSDDGFDFEEEAEPCTRLTDGINLQELISNSSATFEVNTSSEAALEESYGSYFSEKDLLDYVNLDCVDVGSDDETIGQGAPENTPFERIATKMKNITEDGKVKKRVIKPGNGPMVEKDSVVMINYNAYVEYSEEPYDSSYLRGRPVRQKMNEGNFIAGLEVGISTMKKGEVAQFLIHPDYGYGKLGCPPRIPPEAELLIQVELLRITDPSSLETVVQSEGSEKSTFDQIIKKAESLHIMGNDLYKKNTVSAAISKYRKASSILNSMNLANEEEQKKQQKLLCKLHINSAICYNRINNYRMACVTCRLALDIQPRNAKALFNYGRALIGLGDYNQAKSFLTRAQREERNNREINEELEKLDKKMRAYKNDMSAISKRMFSMELSQKDNKPEGKENYSISAFANDVKKWLDSFVKQPNVQTLPLPSGMTHEEVAAFKTEAEKRGLQWQVSFTKGQRQIYVVKPPPQ